MKQHSPEDGTLFITLKKIYLVTDLVRVGEEAFSIKPTQSIESIINCDRGFEYSGFNHISISKITLF